MSAPSMTSYLIEPLVPVIVRAGRPFDGQNGVDAARFPPPSTLAGALRTAHAESTGLALTVELARIPVTGPLPVRLDEHGAPASLLVPKPADALYFHTDGNAGKRPVAARPLPLAAGEGMDLPDAALYSLQLAEPVQGKPADGPRWWSIGDLQRFRRGEMPAMASLENAWRMPEDDIRTHVAIDRGTQAAAAAQLFQTAGLSFAHRSRATTVFGREALPADRVALVGRIDGAVQPGVVVLGGERRLAAIGPCRESLWPSCPADWSATLRRAGGVCFSLLTPALFEAGWRPRWSLDGGDGFPPGCAGLKLKLRAAALDRWLPHSGWDLAKNRPRAGRKQVPAGAAYWFEILDAQNASDAALNALWLATISDAEQDRLDGFGLVLPSAWTFPLPS